ncbi:MAG TPA: hypothetical protein VMT67_06825 [Terriglobales bacterium]|nr:hypothetical protein [Terriglobales bacterium]
MRLRQNSSNAVVVRKEWAHLQAIQMFLRDRADEMQSDDNSHTIIARVLDDTDERGLWIELNRKEHDRDSSVELQAMMIPWHAVLAVVVGEALSSTVQEELQCELSLKAPARGVGA